MKLSVYSLGILIFNLFCGASLLTTAHAEANKSDSLDWKIEYPGKLSKKSGVITVQDRPAVYPRPVPLNYRLTFEARCLDEGERGQIWISPRYGNEFKRYAIALRGGLLQDLYILRYDKDKFPDPSVDYGYAYPLGFKADFQKWIPFRVEVRGGSIFVWAGEVKQPQLIFSDATPLSGGGIALGGSWHRNEFKNVEVTPLPDDDFSDAFSEDATRYVFGGKGRSLPPRYLLSSGEESEGTPKAGWSRKLISAQTRPEVGDPLRKGVVYLNNQDAPATFQMPLQNGEYWVTFGMGHEKSWSHSRISLQGKRYIDYLLAPKEYVTESRQITVSDGYLRLSLDSIKDKALGIVNTVNFIVAEPLESVKNRIPDKEVLRKEQREGYQAMEFNSSGEKKEGDRKEISLSGKWLFMPDQDLKTVEEGMDPKVSDQDWHVVEVPNFWNPLGWWIYTGERKAGQSFTRKEITRVEAQSFDWKSTKSAWYRQWLILKENPDPQKRYLLRFEAVASVAEVYCNGKKVGGHTGMFAPFEVDLSGALVNGKNLIAVNVIGEPKPAQAENEGGVKKVLTEMISMIVTSDHVASLPRGIIYSTIRDMQGRITNQRPGGIWQPVSLQVVDAARIADYFFKPQIKDATVDVTLRNASSEPFSGNVSVSVAGSTEKMDLLIPPNESKKVTLSICPKEVKNWSPEYPHLYTLDLALESKTGQIVDRKSSQVGFRTVETKGDKFYLNGKPYWLGGGNTTCHGLTPNDANLAEKMTKLFAQSNVRISRNHGTPMTKTWLDASDRNGLGISLEGTWSWVLTADTEIPDLQLWQKWVEEMKDLVIDLRNHPSIFIWTISNENHIDWDKNDERRLQKWRMWNELMKTIRELDPTRPIIAYSGYERVDSRHAKISESKDPMDYFDNFIKKNNIWDGDLTDEHRYIGNYGPTIFSYQYKEKSRNNGKGLPVFSQEASTGYPNNDTGHSEAKYIKEYVPQAWVGEDAYEHRNPEPFKDHVALMSKEWLEKVRRDRDTAGWQVFNVGNWFRTPYDLSSLEAYSPINALKTSLQPVLVSLDLRDRHAIFGNSLKSTIHVINDDSLARDLKQLSVVVSLTRLTGEVLQTQKMEVPDCAYYSNVQIPLNFAIPKKIEPSDQCQDYYLKAELSQENVLLSSNQYLMTIASEAWCANSSGNMTEVGYEGTDPKWKDLFAKVNIQLNSSMPEKNKVWVFTTKEVPDLKSPAGQKLLQYVENGGKLLLLQTGKAHQLLPEVIGIKNEKEYLFPEYLTMLNPSHPLFKGIRIHDLKRWNGNGGRPEVCGQVYVIKNQSPETFVPVQYIEPHIGAKTWVNAFRSPIVVREQGKGKIVVCEMRVDVGTTDPIARRFLSNLVQWMDD